MTRGLSLLVFLAVLGVVFSTHPTKAFAGGATCGVVVGFDPATAETDGLLVLSKNGSRESLTVPAGTLLPEMNVGEGRCFTLGQFDGVGLRSVTEAGDFWLQSWWPQQESSEQQEQIKRLTTIVFVFSAALVGTLAILIYILYGPKKMQPN